MRWFKTGRWWRNYKVFIINSHLRFVSFKPCEKCPREYWGFHFIIGGGLRHISENRILEIVW